MGNILIGEFIAEGVAGVGDLTDRRIRAERDARGDGILSLPADAAGGAVDLLRLPMDRGGDEARG